MTQMNIDLACEVTVKFRVENIQVQTDNAEQAVKLARRRIAGFVDMIEAAALAAVLESDIEHGTVTGVDSNNHVITPEKLG